MGRLYRRFSAILAILLSALVLLSFGDFGITYDEPKDHGYGELLWKFYLSAGQDRSFLQYHDLWLYGGAYELIAWPFSRSGILEEYAARHLLNGAVGLLGILGAYRLAGALLGPVAAFWAAMLVAFCPAYLGHMFNNPKDIPFAAGYVWSLYYILQAYRLWPKVRWGTAGKMGLAIGLTMAIRVGGVILIGILGLAILLAIVTGARREIIAGENRRGIRAVALTGAAAYLIMLALWPYAALNPLEGPLYALLHFGDFPWKGSVLFGGRLIDASALPFDYIPRLLFLKLPEVFHAALLGGAVTGTIGTIAIIRERQKRPALSPLPEFLLVISAIILPVLYAAIAGSVLYNGMRHFIFVIPPLAGLAGCSIAKLIRMAGGRGKLWITAAYSLIIAYLAVHGALMVRLHPHHIAYFNSFAGGMSGALNRYELDYWGNSYYELTRRFTGERQRENATNACRIAIMGPYDSALHYLPPECRMVGLDEQPDFIFFPTNSAPPGVGGRVYCVVERFGVPLAGVLDMRKAVLTDMPD